MASSYNFFSLFVFSKDYLYLNRRSDTLYKRLLYHLNAPGAS